MKLKVYNLKDIKNIEIIERPKYTEIEIMEKIVLPENCDHLFSCFMSVEKIQGLNKLDTSKVEQMSCIFIHCESLTALDLSSFDTSNATDLSGMFYGCQSLTSLDLSSFDTSSVIDMNSMFKNCKSLTNLDLSGFDTSSVIDMYEMFYNCEILVIKKCQ